MPVTLVSQNFLRETIHNEISLTKRNVIDKAWSSKIKIPADPASALRSCKHLKTKKHERTYHPEVRKSI